MTSQQPSCGSRRTFCRPQDSGSQFHTNGSGINENVLLITAAFFSMFMLEKKSRLEMDGRKESWKRGCRVIFDHIKAKNLHQRFSKADLAAKTYK